MKRKIRAFLLLLLAFSVSHVQAQSDFCASAVPLTNCTVSPVGSNIGATIGADDTYAAADICALSVENSVWYSFVAPNTGTYDFNLMGFSCNSGTDIQMGVFDGACGALNPLGCVSGGLPVPTLNFPGTAGTTYYIVIDGDAGAECQWQAEVCEQACPTVSFSGLPANMGCTDAAVTLAADDIAANGSFITPGFQVIITTDGFSSTENTIEFFENGSSFAFFPVGTVPDNSIWTLTLEYGDPTAVYSFEWCDLFPDGTFNYEVYDNATGNLIGSGTFNHNGGTTCFTFVIGNVSGSATFSGAGITDTGFGVATFDPVLAGPGTHTIQYCFDDGAGCIDCTTQDVTVSGPLPPTAGTDAIYCFGDPLANLTASGGGGDLEWFDDVGLTNMVGTGGTHTPSNTPGTTVYYITETSGGCQSNPATVTVTINPNPTISNVAVTDPQCTGAGSGSIDITANGGTTPYQYSTDNGVTFQAGNVFNGLASGTYNIVVEDANGCQVTTQVTLTDPPMLVITNVATIHPNCAGAADGGIDITAGGGTSPLQYSIDNGVTFQASNTFSGLGAGTYDIVVEDANGCQATTQVTLTDPPALIHTTTTIDPQCNGDLSGTINITANGGATPYQYSIDNGTTFQASNSFAGLGAGAYSIVVEDANGCQSTSTVTLTNPPAITYTVVLTNPNCGATDGAIVITGAGGDGGPYQYSIDNGVTFQGSGSFTNLGAGTYNVVVEDGSGCQATGVEALSNLSGPTIDNIANTDPLCNGDLNGTITITASGGTPPLQYSADNGITFQASNSFVGLGAGIYSIVIEDANGCQSTSTVTLTAPPAVAYTIVLTDPNCGATDGAIVITGTGGDGGPYQYSIDNGVTFQGTGSFTGLGAGAYDVVVVDGSGCQTTGTETLNNLNGPTIDNTASSDPLCNADLTGAITITASGGTPPLQYSIDNGSTFQGSGSFTGLGAGTYDIVVEDGVGCQSLQTITLTDPQLLAFNTIVTDESCNVANGSITIPVIGGVPPLQFSIDNGVTFQASNLFTGLAAGTYNIVVEDANGCQASGMETVAALGGVSLDSVSIANASCNGICDGAVTAFASGGATPYTYQWLDDQNNPIAGETNTTYVGVCAGTYTVEITDAGGCSAIQTVTIIEPAAVIASFIASPTSGIAPLNVNVTNTSTGAVAYLWDFGDGTTSVATDPTITYTTNGTYTIMLIATNSAGCLDTAFMDITVFGEATIIVPNVFTPNADGTNDVFAVQTTGIETLGATIFNRWGQKIYEWNTTNGWWDGRTISGLEAPEGTYYFRITAIGFDGTELEESGSVTMIRE